MENLKTQVVARGDLQHRDEFTDTWSSCASMKRLSKFSIIAAKLLKRVKQVDFIGAYLQAKATGRFFIRLPDIYKQYFPTMSKYFGRPLRLRKVIYGLTLSGKLWVTEFSEWLLNQGFIQSKAEPAYFILYKDKKTWLRLIFYIDDMLCFGSNEQMRIHQHKDGSYSLDQTRYTSNIIHKYNPKTCLWGLPQQISTQVPPEYVYSKENRPLSKEEEEKFPGLDF
eukprot:11227961-Ditylum_brightwellii.AAC.1